MSNYYISHAIKFIADESNKLVENISKNFDTVPWDFFGNGTIGIPL
jgi:hypothetical protein